MNAMGNYGRLRSPSATLHPNQDGGCCQLAPGSNATALRPCSLLPVPCSAARESENRFPRGVVRAAQRGFTLVEILASLLLMAIIVPVAMQGMSTASRAGMMGQRKVAALRVAERVLNDLVVTGQTSQASSSGTMVEGNASYPWTLETENWSEDSMLQLTVRVTFTVQGNEYMVSASTLIDPLAPPPTALGEDVM